MAKTLDWGRALRMLGAAATLTQEELAKQAGVSPSHLAAIRAGRTRPGGRQSHPKIDTLLKLSEATGIDVSTIITWAEF